VVISGTLIAELMNVDVGAAVSDGSAALLVSGFAA
jgi:hypothetical protein